MTDGRALERTLCRGSSNQRGTVEATKWGGSRSRKIHLRRSPTDRSISTDPAAQVLLLSAPRNATARRTQGHTKKTGGWGNRSYGKKNAAMSRERGVSLYLAGGRWGDHLFQKSERRAWGGANRSPIKRRSHHRNRYTKFRTGVDIELLKESRSARRQRSSLDQGFQKRKKSQLGTWMFTSRTLSGKRAANVLPKIEEATG